MRHGKEFYEWWFTAHLKSLLFNANRGENVEPVDYISQHPMCWGGPPRQSVTASDDNLSASFGKPKPKKEAQG